MLSLDYRDARPIYEQVRDGLRRLVVTGALVQGEKLPSVRAMASTLAINPNTIQRAYEALEAEDTCTRCRGRGPLWRSIPVWTGDGRSGCCIPLTRRRRSCCTWG